MGELSEYYEDFPEENPANYVGERFDPAGAKRLREAQAQAKRKLAQEQMALDAEMLRAIEEARKSLQQRKESEQG